MASTKSSTTSGEGWWQELSSLSVAVLVGVPLLGFPSWDPLSTVQTRTGVAFMGGLGLLSLVYLLLQGLPIVMGRVGSAFGLITDAVFSLSPAIPVLLAIAFDLFGYKSLSFTGYVIGFWTLGLAAFDVVVFGGVRSLVNRLTDDINMRGKDE